MLANVPARFAEPDALPGASTPAVAFHRVSATGLLGHDDSSKAALAEWLAEVMGRRYDDAPMAVAGSSCPRYLVPSQTLVGIAKWRRLNVKTADDLFGGVVPEPFMATKVISHPLFDRHGHRPRGWSDAFADAVGGAVLPGWSVFSAVDAWHAGLQLLAHGHVRLKDPRGVGGSDQCVVRTPAALRERLASLDAAALARDGLVLECDLRDVSTLSVGQAEIPGLRISYIGHQRVTRNHRGAEVYGGSDLDVVRGGFDTLLAQPLEPAHRLAIEQAVRYHEAALRCFDGMFASRCNYDVAQGVDEAGRWHSGVLEQSWRIGGASGAEIGALHAMAADPALRRIRASTHEVYGGLQQLPVDARVLFDGTDDAVGRITKYVQVAAGEHH